MGVIVCPYFMGEPLRGLETPTPARVLGPTLPPGAPQERMAILYADLAEAVATEPRPLVFAGDCVSAIGVLAGLQRRGLDPALVWFDAHGDFHTWRTTRSHFIGGMPLAMIVGRGEQTILDGAGCTPLTESRVLLVGARDLDPGEDEAVAASGMASRSVPELIGADLEAALPAGPLYVHVDLDVIDPSEMPAHNYPAPGGPGLADVERSLVLLVATGRVTAVSFSCWNPALPGADRAAAGARRLAAAVLRERPAAPG